MYDQNNIFAKIIKKEIPAKVVYEDNKVLSFYTIEPLAKIHVLVIPKGEYTDYKDFTTKASDETICDFFKKVHIIAKQLNIEDSYKLITNYGSASSQEVFHFHVHLLAGVFK
ncbi:MAG: HIT domain-containing protein [Alphaproteobacteria bacterium]|nr:HIT domain-containing protein [Rickettsiales bacterium]